ncbi:diguanylate cyclase [Rhodobacteraceae bacterium]|nr:diguanylate cyclase [Paracoccaceae bacterium]
MAGKILIVAGAATSRIMLKVKLSQARYMSRIASCGQEALEMAANERPDLILIDTDLPDISGTNVCARLKQDALTGDIPVVVMTDGDCREQRIEALRAGADTCLSKPYDEVLLFAYLRGLLRAHGRDSETRLHENTFRELGFEEGQSGFSGPYRIGLVAQRPELSILWKRALSHHVPTDFLKVLDLNDTTDFSGFDALVIDADLARPGDGLRLMAELRSRGASRHAVICITTRPDARETMTMALDLGANDIFPFDIAAASNAEETALRLRRQLITKNRLDRQRESVAEGLRLAMVDPLTGLFNRRYALPHLKRIAQHARVTGGSFAVMMLDIDHFKKINDSWGHMVGDLVLVEIAQRLSSVMRRKDLLARIGGEEFLMALPECQLDKAEQIAATLCRKIEEVPVIRPDGGALQVTISIGVTISTGNTPQRELIDMADHALRHSKANGRNQVQIHHHTSAA